MVSSKKKSSKKKSSKKKLPSLYENQKTGERFIIYQGKRYKIESKLTTEELLENILDVVKRIEKKGIKGEPRIRSSRIRGRKVRQPKEPKEPKQKIEKKTPEEISKDVKGIEQVEKTFEVKNNLKRAQLELEAALNKAKDQKNQLQIVGPNNTGNLPPGLERPPEGSTLLIYPDGNHQVVDADEASKLVEAKEQNDLLTIELQNKKTELENKSEEYADKINQLSILQERLDDLEDQEGISEAKLRKLEKQEEKLQDQIKKLGDEIDDKNKEVKRLTGESKEAREKAEFLEKKLKDAEDKLNNTKHEAEIVKKLSNWEKGSLSELKEIYKKALPGAKLPQNATIAKIIKVFQDKNIDITKLEDTNPADKGGRHSEKVSKIIQELKTITLENLQNFAKDEDVDISGTDDPSEIIKRIRRKMGDDFVKITFKDPDDDDDDDEGGTEENPSGTVNIESSSDDNNNNDEGGTVNVVSTSNTANEPAATSTTNGSESTDHEYSLWNTQIEKFMNKYRSKGFKGVFPADRVSEVPVKKSDKKVSFVMNTAKLNDPGKHWVSVLLTKEPPTLEYFDSLVEEPSPLFERQIKVVLKKLLPQQALIQYKINRVKLQSSKTSTCGYHAMSFLKDRLGENKTFKEATRFTTVQKVMEGEKKATKLREEIEDFGYVRL